MDHKDIGVNFYNDFACLVSVVLYMTTYHEFNLLQIY